MSLKLILGCMYSGKTTELLRRLFNEAEVGLNVLYINHASDNRSAGPFSTHNPLYKQKLSTHSNVTFKSGKALKNIINLEEYDVIGIDGRDHQDHLPVKRRILSRYKHPEVA